MRSTRSKSRPFTVYFRTTKISRHECPHEALTAARKLGPGWRIESVDDAAYARLEKALNGKQVFKVIDGKPMTLNIKTGEYEPVIIAPIAAPLPGYTLWY